LHFLKAKVGLRRAVLLKADQVSVALEVREWIAEFLHLTAWYFAAMFRQISKFRMIRNLN
jgi:hypothetical protein